MTGCEIAQAAARIADEKKGQDIVIYDLRSLSDVADYFVVVTALSKLQLRAIAAEIERSLKEQGVPRLGLEGSAASQWVLLDYCDVVVHLFSPALREYYELEALWGDAPKIEWQDPAAGKSASG